MTNLGYQYMKIQARICASCMPWKLYVHTNDNKLGLDLKILIVECLNIYALSYNDFL